MGFVLVIAGFLLLFNPVINVFDVIPDAIGFFLIVAGLTKLSYFVDRISKARGMFLKLALVELLKIASIFTIVGDVNSGSTKVLLSFVFGIGEAVMFTLAVMWLFEGLSFSAVVYNATKVSEITKTKRGKNNDVFLRTRNYIIFFYIFRCIATLIPELTELQMYDHIGEVHSYSVPLTYFKDDLYKLFGALVIILGIIYIVRVISYFTALKKDTQYRENFIKTYEDTRVTRPEFFLAHRMMTSLVLFTFGAVLTFTLLIDNVNILIGAISGVFFAVSALTMRKYVPKAWIILPFVGARIVFSVVSFIEQVRYFGEYSADAVFYVDKAASMYYKMAFFGCVDMFFAAALLTVFSVILITAVRDHLKVCGVIEETAQFSKSRRDKETLQYLKRRIIPMTVFGIIYFASAAAYRYLSLDRPEWIAVFVALSFVFIAYSIHTTSSVNRELYEKEVERA